MEKIILNNEPVYLKRGWLGWKTISPVRNEDGSFNIFNLIFGGKRGLFTLSVYAIIIILLALGFNEVISGCRDAAENPCDYCGLSEDYYLNPEYTNFLRLNGEKNISEIEFDAGDIG